MHPFFFFVLILLFTSTANATSDEDIIKYILDIDNQEYWNGDWEIAREHGNPIVVWKDNCYKSDVRPPTISAWIDIIGFKDESVIDGGRYVNGSPRDFAIVKRDAKYHVPRGCVFVSFDSTLSIVDYEYDDGRVETEATQVSTFVYKEWVCETGAYGIVDCWWVFYKDTFAVSYMTESPSPYTIRIQDVPIYITVCNRSFQPVTHIRIPGTTAPSMLGVMDVLVSYNGSNVSRYDRAGFVVDNSRGTEHVEFVPFDGPTWIVDDNQTMASHFLGVATIHDPDFNMSNLQIRMRTPYETRDTTNHTITQIEEDTPITLNMYLMRVIALLCGSIIAILALVGVIPRALHR